MKMTLIFVCTLAFMPFLSLDLQAQDCSRPGTCRHVPGNRPGADRPRPPVVRPHHPNRPPVVRPHNSNRPPVVRPHRPSRPPVVDRPPHRRPNRHIVHRDVPRHPVRYTHPRDYTRTVPARYYYHNTWVRIDFNTHDGYYWDQYPYYVWNGYQHRYSPIEYCDYELVDGDWLEVHTRYYNLSCQQGYDLCAEHRDDLNWYEGHDRFFCAERI